MALIFSIFLWPPEPLLQYPGVRAQLINPGGLSLRKLDVLVPVCFGTRLGASEWLGCLVVA